MRRTQFIQFTAGPLRILFFLFLVSALTLSCTNQVAEDEPNLENLTCWSDRSRDIFIEVEPESPRDSMTPDDHRVLRSRRVKINLELLASTLRVGEQLRMKLFDDRTFIVRLTFVEWHSDQNAVVTGEISDGDQIGFFTLIYNNEVVVANFKSGVHDAIYEIRPDTTGSHVIRETAVGVDQCDPVTARDEMPFHTPDSDYPMAALPSIDILVAYTPAALNDVGGTDTIQALIQTGVADMNTALISAGINLRVRLVGTLLLQQNESGNYSSDLSSLRESFDGIWDEVHAARAKVGADQVTLVGAYLDNWSTSGIGYLNSQPTSAFSIVKTTSFSQYTFAHELGHNIGLNHEDGFQNNDGEFRTIMAYGYQKRIPRFSSSLQLYEGFALGTSAQDSVAIIKRRTAFIPSFFPTRIAPVVNNYSSSGPAPNRSSCPN